MKFKENNSIYQQIADRLSEEILRGRYGEEERLPSVREYAALLEVNINTALRAYDMLQQQEVIYNRRGIGYFVSKGAQRSILTARRNSFLRDDLQEFFYQIHTLGIPMDDIEESYRQYVIKQQNNKTDKQ
jgi:GntR family transcriptional regulator